MTSPSTSNGQPANTNASPTVPPPPVAGASSIGPADPAFGNALEGALGWTQCRPFKADATAPIYHWLGRYSWNVALATSLWPLLHALEITLRNRMDTAITRSVSLEGRTKGLGDHWFDVTPAIITADDYQTVQRTMQDIARDRVSVGRFSILRRLPFGFWVRLLHDDYETPRAHKVVQLWPQLLNDVFPSYRGNRQEVYDRFRALKDLRNAVAHHEPIILRRDLSGEYKAALDALRWMTPQGAKAIQRTSKFWEVFRMGEDALRAELEQLGRENAPRPTQQNRAAPTTPASET